MIIDTHAHLTMMNDDGVRVINNMKDDNVGAIVTIGTTLEDSRESVEWAEKYDNIYATVGIYPDFSLTTTDEDLETIKDLAKSEKVVAIGEIGLNYYGDDYDKESQKELFVKQLKIADELGLPFCIHCRNAGEDMYEVLSENKHLINHSGLMHCYSEGAKLYKEFLDLGLYLSFSGNITYKKTDRSYLKDVPLDKILVETDAPYLAPEPLRGRKNESKNIKYIIEKIADELEMDAQELEKITEENAKRFYFKMK
ncbi:MAG: TatD family hydrolase [Clostridia bacterium]|nr:TatD family hydrolase [Clostridia bacterium]